MEGTLAPDQLLQATSTLNSWTQNEDEGEDGLKYCVALQEERM